MLVINQVHFPKIVNAGDPLTIIVEADSTFKFDDLDNLTWNTVENRGLLWHNIDDTPNFDDDLEKNQWSLVETMTWDDLEE